MRLWTKIEGVDVNLVLRTGNISATGIYLDIDNPVGNPGTLQTLTMASIEDDAGVSLPVRVVREVSYRDLWRGDMIAGVACEFMPEDETKRRDLVDFILQTMRERLAHVEPVLPRERQDVRGGLLGTLEGLSQAAVLFDTPWPITPGQPVRVQLKGAGDVVPVTLDGTAARATIEGPTEAQRYRLEVHFGDATESSGEAMVIGSSIHDVVQNLMLTAMGELDLPRSGVDEQLKGQLARVKLPTLLTLLDMERLTGLLRLRGPAGGALMYVREGRVIDVDGEDIVGRGHALLKSCLSWGEGTFEFVATAVDREDVIHMNVTQLLQEQTREHGSPSDASA